MEFIGVKSQQKIIRESLDKSISRVLDNSNYIMGKEVFQMEDELSRFCGSNYTLSCSSGTDALLLSLMSLNIGKGDAVFVPSFTFSATVEVIILLGATPVFIDVRIDTFNICVDSLCDGILKSKEMNLVPKVVIGVDIFGQPADWDKLLCVAQKYNLKTVDDAAQGFGSVYKNKLVGNIADITTTSFFPSKPLGCYGDGGAVFTNDKDLNDIMVSLRVHGQDQGNKYKNIRVGLNARMDTIQCVILLEKLKIFGNEIELRNKVAFRYNKYLSDIVTVPYQLPSTKSTWAQYTILLPKGVDRQNVQDRLQSRGVPSAVYYPIPAHKQEAYKTGVIANKNGLLGSEMLSNRVLSLPMHPYLDIYEQDLVIESLKQSL